MQKITGLIILAIMHAIPCLAAADHAGAVLRLRRADVEMESKEAAAKRMPPIYKAPSILCEDMPDDVSRWVRHQDVQCVLGNRNDCPLFYVTFFKNRHMQVIQRDEVRIPPFESVTIPLPMMDVTDYVDVSAEPVPTKTGSRITFTKCDTDDVIRDRHLIVTQYNRPADFFTLLFVRPRLYYDRRTFYIDLVKNKTEVGPKILAFPLSGYSAQEAEALYKELAGIVPQFLVTPVAPMVCKYLIGDAAYDYEHKRAEAALSASGGSRSEGNGFGAGPIARALLGRSLKGVRKSPATVSAEATANTVGTNAGPGATAE